MDAAQLNKAISKFRFGLKARISLYERLADFLDNKFPVEETLELIAQRYHRNKDYRGAVINNWRRKMAVGQKFSDAIKEDVPAEERVLIAAGENSAGGLSQGLREAIRLSKSMSAIKSTVISGVTYPIMLISLMLSILVMFYTQIAPAYVNILAVERWPASAQYMYYISEFVTNRWYVVVATLIGIGWGVGFTMPRWVGSTRQTMDNFLPYSVYRDYQGAAFLIALSSMMKSGISLNDALRRVQEKGSPWLQEHINRMLRKLRVSGSDYGKALDTGLLDSETSGDIQDYSRLSTFEHSVYSIGEKSMVKTVQVIATKMAFVRIFMLGIVVTCIIGIFGTSFTLQQEMAEASKMTRVK
jgi:type II secretory pathway component PulF